MSCCIRYSKEAILSLEVLLKPQEIVLKIWNNILESLLVTNLMVEAEAKFDNGADRKEWVLAMVQASADTINYEIDIEEVGKLIDNLCAMSKLVNAPSKKD